VHAADGKVQSTFNAKTGTSVFNRRDGGTTVSRPNAKNEKVVTRSYNDGTRVHQNMATGAVHVTQGSRSMTTSRAHNGFYSRTYSRGSVQVYSRTYVTYVNPYYGSYGLYTPHWWGGGYPTYFGFGYPYYGYYSSPWINPYVWSSPIWWGASYYSWGWYTPNSWYYGYYQPYTSYPSLSWWMADYYTASTLNNYYESQRADRLAREQARADRIAAQRAYDEAATIAADQVTIARLKAELEVKDESLAELEQAKAESDRLAKDARVANQEPVKLAKVEEDYINTQVSAQVTAAVAAISAKEPKPLDASVLMDQGNIFNVHEPVTTKISVNGEDLECALSEGDYVQKAKESKPIVVDSEDDNGKPTKVTYISAKVLKSKQGSCKLNSLVTIALSDLQEMTNDFVAGVEASAKAAQEKGINEAALKTK
jgi:hypothetical protein